MRISQRSIEVVRETSNIVEVASEFTALKRQGARFSGLCPYPDHQEKTPSFSVTPEQGFYYCFGCLEANERIWTNKGLIPIASAEVGDEVIGLEGRRETILDKWFKSGPTIRIKTGAAKEGIALTPDHHCVFVKKAEALRAISAIPRRHSEAKEIRFSGRLRATNTSATTSVDYASEVREGDFWLYPVIPDDERNNRALAGRGVIQPYSKEPHAKRITGLHVNSETAWLYGLWLAEGSLYEGGVKWSFAAHEADTLAERVVNTLQREFGRDATRRTLRPDKDLCEVMCSSIDLAALFGRWFGSDCGNKRVPVEALSWVRDCQAALIRGYIDGAGHAVGRAARAFTVSEELAYGILALSVQSGKVCSVSYLPARVGSDGVQRRKCYQVHILSRESLNGFFAEIDGANYYWSPVEGVETSCEEPTTVVDITTTGSHTFTTKMGVTHNCQRGGDAIKLVTDLKSLSFAEAVSYLAERSGTELEFEGASDADAKAAKQRNLRRRNIHKALAAAAIYYHKYLMKSRSPEAQEARQYLNKRGISTSTIEEFRLGYAPPRGSAGFPGVAGRFDLDRRTLDAAGLLSSWGGERFAGRITFPISDRRGRMVGFGARALGDDHPKYLNSPETDVFNKRELLYGFPQVAEAIRKERAALVVEGYTDVLMLYQSGIKNAVATLGTATTPAHLKTLSGYADTIHLLFDPDAAGEKAIERAAVTASELKLDLRVLRLSDDPADWLLQHPPEEFDGLLEGSNPVLEYIFRRKADRARGAGAAERARTVSEIKDLLQNIEDPVFYRDAIRVATEALGVSPEALHTPNARQGVSRYPSDDRRRAVESPSLQAGREVLALIMSRPDLTKTPLVEGVSVAAEPEPVRLNTSDFSDETQARIFALLSDYPGDDLDAVFADERARMLMDDIAALHAEGERLYPSDAAVREAWLRLAILSRQRAKQDTPDLDTKERLHSEIQSLKAALRAVSSEP